MHLDNVDCGIEFDILFKKIIKNVICIVFRVFIQ